MSAQFGRWNFGGEPAAPTYLNSVSTLLVPYGPDGRGSYSDDAISILYFAFCSTFNADALTQPHASRSGAIITWDGRLDNRDELIGALGADLSSESADVVIAAAAYDRWSTASFARLLGDWALSIWDPRRQVVILAKDPIGTRPLYYSYDHHQITWSTTLEPLILLGGDQFKLCEEYLAGCLALYPATHLTPYTDVFSVPPSSWVRVTPRQTLTTKYWDFNPEKKVRYRTDGEYEEHFRTVFEQSVKRRLRSHFPILAELSGGMDSSSIVCVADRISGHENIRRPRVNTVSFYDDSEPSWDERPYFTAVEQRRGRSGCHIAVDSDDAFAVRFDSKHFPVTPAAQTRDAEAARQLAAYIQSSAIRVVLSGTGGDEVLGGVPTPLPELRDLIVQVELKKFSKQLKTWALNKRRPWFWLLFQSVQGFLPPVLGGTPKFQRPAPWLDASFVARNQRALSGYESRIRILGALPSFQENINALEGLKRQLAFTPLPCDPSYERRYPYLDLDLLEFAFAIPREQHVRPGQRRSLMRRSLAGIVPDAVLNRKRKAFPSRRPMLSLSAESAKLRTSEQGLVTRSLGMINQSSLFETLEKCVRGEEVAIVQVMRTIAVEHWLRVVTQQKPMNLGQSGEALQPAEAYHA